MKQSNPELNAQVKNALISDPELEAALLRDLGGTLASRFGAAMPEAGTLARGVEDCVLTIGGRAHSIADPRQADPGELDDAELELVSGGGDKGGSPSGGSPAMPSPGANTYIDEFGRSLISKS